MLPDFDALLSAPEYSFLHTHPRLGNRIILLALSGSYGYGTYREGSDIDLRGITLPLPSDLLGLSTFEQYVDQGTDTVLFAFRKFVDLLMECNPNCCEILGLPRDRYLILSPLGEELLRNQHLFLSKRCIPSFGGYAAQQLRRLQNAVARDALSQSKREEHIRNSVERSLEDFRSRNERVQSGSMRLYIDRAVTEGLETEIFVDTDYTHLPLRDFSAMLETMHHVVRDYDKIGHRNHKKDENHLCKHAMHLLRLLMTATDILEKEEIITCRTEDLPTLLAVRNGEYLRTDGTFSPEFYALIDAWETRFHEAARQTKLPDAPDKEKIGQFVERVHRKAIEEEYA
ncbi:MAG: nucleotidyltransferase domain-containing protein [Clostridia bacterium]|nr:nucleotidyltransferase domain-containing protein [Clostridia bacterium]MBR2288776.1 nucleotidyltransferase domain-containing protein [Clostridia bacterium]